MNKQIYVEWLWKPHAGDNEQWLQPPEGYEVVMKSGLMQNTATWLSRFTIAYRLLGKLQKLIPVYSVKSYLDRFKKPPAHTALTYSYAHFIHGKRPWVLEIEGIWNLCGGNANFLRRDKRMIERTLAAKDCKRIIFWNDMALKSFLSTLDCTAFTDKMEKVNLGRCKCSFTRTNDSRHNIKLLFVNSSNIRGNFELKGGVEVLEAFTNLVKIYPNLELVLRSDIPSSLKNKYAGVHNLRIIEGVLPWEMLEQEFQSADIFLAPGYITPAWVLLDAMSYELPIVATDVWCTTEFVTDGETGILIRKSERVLPWQESFYLDSQSHEELKGVLKKPDTQVVQQLVQKTSILIENPELRRQMGKAGRWEVDHGKFSIRNRNEKLKRIFDEATGT